MNRTVNGSKMNSNLTYSGVGISSSSRNHQYPTSSNIVSLNLANNNISMIEQSFFQTVETVLKVCELSFYNLLEQKMSSYKSVAYGNLHFKNVLIVYRFWISLTTAYQKLLHKHLVILSVFIASISVLIF